MTLRIWAVMLLDPKGPRLLTFFAFFVAFFLVNQYLGDNLFSVVGCKVKSLGSIYGSPISSDLSLTILIHLSAFLYLKRTQCYVIFIAL